MKQFSDLIKETEKMSGCKQCPSFRLITIGPFVDETRGEIPTTKGVYFGFEFDQEKAEEGILVFTRLVYVGKASESNNLRKRISDHYTQEDLRYRETKKKVDMKTIAFFCCEMENDDDIANIEAAQIFKQQPPANEIGVDTYLGECAPLLISFSNGFKFVDSDLYKNPILIRSSDKK